MVCRKSGVEKWSRGSQREEGVRRVSAKFGNELSRILKEGSTAKDGDENVSANATSAMRR